MTRYITTKEAAVLLRISERGVRKMIEHKKFKDIKKCDCHQAWLININECKQTVDKRYLVR